MNISAVMDEIAAKLATLPAGLRVHAYPVPKVTPPAAIVSYPDELLYDATYGRGMDRMTLPVVLIVGKASERSARDVLTRYVAGAGAYSIKALLDNATWASCHVVRVASAEFDVHTIAGIDYLAAVFDCEIAGSGA